MGKTIRICKRCMRSWNVSSIDPPGKSDYICPECEAKMEEGENSMSEEEKEYIDAIRKRLSDQVLVVHSAEEALELALACLKMYRVLEGSNPTPITFQQAHESILEEYGDLENCMTVLRYNVPSAVQARREIRKSKLARWVERLMGRG